MGDELPDFYNIVLERPRDDPTGYDVMFIDAAAKVWSAPPIHLNIKQKQPIMLLLGGEYLYRGRCDEFKGPSVDSHAKF